MVNILSLATAFMTALSSALATPTPLSSRGYILPRTALHDCGVYIQRWAADNSFDIYLYHGPGTQEAFDTVAPFESLESVSLHSPETLPTYTVGSHELVITDTADPVNNNDPGKLSFVWGSESWESWTRTDCSVTAIGNAGALEGGATTYACTYQCDY